MDNKETQELDLDELLSELHDLTDEAEQDVNVEADEELKELLDLPDLDITPVVVKVPEAEPSAEPDLSVQTIRFDPPTAEEPAEETDEAALETSPAVSQDATIQIPELPAEEIAEETAEETAAKIAAELSQEEFTAPAPIVFTPRSRLRELKKKLVAGPEKRYYELSEQGLGKLQLAILA